jgi:hypothetical protein
LADQVGVLTDDRGDIGVEKEYGGIITGSSSD